MQLLKVMVLILNRLFHFGCLYCSELSLEVGFKHKIICKTELSNSIPMGQQNIHSKRQVSYAVEYFNTSRLSKLNPNLTNKQMNITERANLN